MDREFLVFQIGTPLMLVYMMGYSFSPFLTEGGTVDGIPYPLYLATGIMAFNAIFACQWVGIGIWEDRRNGMFTQFMLMPISRGQYLFSRLLFNFIFALFSMTVVIIGYPPLLFHLLSSDVNLLYPIFAILLLTLFYGSISILIAIKIKSNQSFYLLITFFAELSAFTSSALYPSEAEKLPEIISIIFYLNPISLIVDIMRAGIFSNVNSLLYLEIIIMSALAFLATLIVKIVIQRTEIK
jgi:ABC-2 type transport system permease protein